MSFVTPEERILVQSPDRDWLSDQIEAFHKASAGGGVSKQALEVFYRVVTRCAEHATRLQSLRPISDTEHTNAREE